MREPARKLGRSGGKGIGAFLSVMLVPAKTIAELSLILFVTSGVLMLALTSAPQDSRAPRTISSKDSLNDLRVLSAQQINRRTLGLAAAIDASEK